MDLVFVAMLGGLYALTHGLVWALRRLKRAS
jgi:hypothetical protein